MSRRTNVLDLREMIRHFKAGESIRTTAKALGLNRETAGNYRTWLAEQGWLDGELPDAAEIDKRLAELRQGNGTNKVSVVEPYRAIVEDLRAQGVEARAIYQRIHDDHGYQGSYSSVWRFVKMLDAPSPEQDAVVRIEVKPGEEAQVDFGYVGRMFDPARGELRKAWAFVMTLAWSRHQYVEFVFDQRVDTWLMLHRHAFEFFGGVPKRVVLDNLKAAIVKASVDDPQVQRAYRECALHYDFLISPCRVATPEHKGKVESGVHYVQRNLLGGRKYVEPQHNVQHANRDALVWVKETAGLRRHGTTRRQPLAQFEAHERAALRPLPETAFEVVTWKQVRLHRDCHVVFENGYYSAPCRLIGQTLWVRGTARFVQIYADYELVASHTRVSEPGQRQTSLAHLPQHKITGLLLDETECRRRASEIGPHTSQVLERILEGKPVDQRRTARHLIDLATQYSDTLLEHACAKAFEHGDPTLATVRGVLQTVPATPPAPPMPAFARSVEELLPAGWTGASSWN